ncbi:hypothetical protein [Amnibacterium kyonggiense]|uniref:Uncharacterized protein n=1 Tax=Amnibacterium kyonggiense TaxID=595671 RepID=A0A4R7FIC6_9MICO|nr:hypothetical protein [Amnibacterium kyonggiense]TDS75791.1 hypothetical protein CLV52_2900 [Amnibacterium kyonggiense]
MGGDDEAETSAFEVEERRLRAALYAPRASAHDLDRYQRHLVSRQDAQQAESSAAAGERTEPGSAPAGRRNRRLVVLAGAAAVVLAALLGVWVAGVGRAPAPVTDTTHRPGPTAGGPASSSLSTRAAPTAHDGGKREFATGPASVIAPGTFRYTIAAGDTELGIAAEEMGRAYIEAGIDGREV